jgi:hypothetical protein
MCYIGNPTRMMFTNAHRAVGCALALILGAATLSAQAPQGLRVVPVVRDNSDYLLVTVELREGLTPEVRAAIESGLKTIFTYTVELRLDVPGWVDRTVATSVVTNSVEFDNLSRIHTFERRVDGRSEKPRTTESVNEVRDWMTNMKDLPLFRTRILVPNREYYVRVSATARPSYGSILWPFGSGVSAQTKFVFR